MAQQELIKEVGAKLTELKNRFENISSSGDVHLIDVDILLHLIRDIYLKTSLLKKDGDSPAPDMKNETHGFISPNSASQPYTPALVPEFTAPSPPHIPGQVSGISAINQPHEELTPEPQPEITFTAAPITIPEPQKIPEIESVPPPPSIPSPEKMPELPKVPPTIPEPAPQPVTIPEPEPSHIPASNSYMKSVQVQPELFGNGSLADKHKSDAISINDRMVSAKSDHTLADKIKLTPLRDIKAAIGINEKFQFINELFEGSGELYNEAISLLNNCTSAYAANQLFFDYQHRNNWDSENKAFLKFKEYVDRRYLQS